MNEWFRDVLDGPGPTDLARGKRTVTVIAYRLFHSPAKDLRYSAAANHINRQRSTLQKAYFANFGIFKCQIQYIYHGNNNTLTTDSNI